MSLNKIFANEMLNNTQSFTDFIQQLHRIIVKITPNTVGHNDTCGGLKLSCVHLIECYVMPDLLLNDLSNCNDR